MRLIWRTDVHMSDKTPRGRSDNWTETVLDKLVQIGVLATDLAANGVLDGGDFFNDKNPSNNSHDLVRRTAKVHAKYPCPVFANVGNHDVRYGSLDYLDESPLAVCFETGIFKPCTLSHDVQLKDAEGCVVRIVGIPYQGAKFDFTKLHVPPGPEDHLVVMLHQLASADPSLVCFPGEDVIPYGMFPSLFPSASVVCVGHWHKDQGIVQYAPNQWVVNIGSLTRGTLAEDDVQRKPQVAILDLHKGQPPRVVAHPLKYRPPQEVFKDKVEVEARPTLDVTALAEVAVAVGTFGQGLSLEDQVRTLPNVSEAARERVLDAFRRTSTTKALK